MTPTERAEHCIRWITANCRVLGDSGQGIIPFALFDYQQDFIRTFWAHREVICLKARQIGMTETMAALAVYCSHQFAGWTIIILSKDQDAANEVLSKCRIAYDYLPADVRIPVVNPSITSTLKLVNRSRIIPKPTSPGAGRSFNAQLLILDEWAHQMWQDIVYAAASPMARSAGNKIVGLSTANGVGNFFYKQWKLAEAGRGMVPVFLPWDVRPGRDAAWYDQATRGYDDWQKAQELPHNAEEAFILSGRPRFDTDALRAIADHCSEPRQTDLGGMVRIWESPTQNGRYVIGADTSEGLPKGDYSAAVVFDYYTGLDVAELHGRMEPEEFATHLAALGRWYNDAYMAVEYNMHGAAVLLALTTLHQYPNLHYQQDVFGNPSDKPGWKTTTASKPVMIDGLATTIRERRPYRNAAFIGEAMTYALDDKGATNASGDSFDDRVIAYALAEQMRLWVPLATTVEHRIEDLQLQDYTVDSRY